MGTPGYSIPELIKTIRKCKDIYDGFTDEYSSAPACVQELVDTCNFLQEILHDSQSLLGVGYPHQTNFAQRIAECEAFINKYRNLKHEFFQSVPGRPASAQLVDTWKKAWQTTKYVLDEKKARDIKSALSLEIQKLVLFILVFAL
jgi:hypothetical protein